jgi:hypothetical protein
MVDRAVQGAELEALGVRQVLSLGPARRKAGHRSLLHRAHLSKGDHQAPPRLQKGQPHKDSRKHQVRFMPRRARSLKVSCNDLSHMFQHTPLDPHQVGTQSFRNESLTQGRQVGYNSTMQRSGKQLGRAQTGQFLLTESTWQMRSFDTSQVFRSPWQRPHMTSRWPLPHLRCRPLWWCAHPPQTW